MARRTRTTPPRRLVAGLGALGIVAGTITVTAGLSAPAAHAATISLNYHCTASAFGATLDQKNWTAAVTVDLPKTVNIGEEIPAPKVTAKVTTSTDSGDTMRGLGVKMINGTSDAAYTFGTQKATAKLTIGDTDVPTSGPITTSATGNGEAATAPSTPTQIPVKIGDFTGSLNAYSDPTDPSKAPLVLGLSCTLLEGQDTQIGVVQVVDPNAPTSSTTSSPSSSDSSSPTSSDSSSPSSTTSSTDSASPTSTTTGPPIITDGGSTDGGLNGSILGGAAVAALGIGAIGYGMRRRLNSGR